MFLSSYCALALVQHFGVFFVVLSRVELIIMYFTPFDVFQLLHSHVGKV